ncbi:hypothetical protein BZA05DRAFT_446717 [Tricharina praecox]|uniref:uncharacterized protein n=1 Tax=Tricharina praecox TaxID=43433 RepID=UPI00221F840A|nr:uncharacterized protein BZA05DRAFT_446717 [Tricharina praecox]KAI5847998.1 hypothetical protein BZA05DRAFT_446717 [Tricharina praecox]
MEVAGLVLAILPLFLNGLRQIDDGSRKVFGYRRALGRLVQKIEVEAMKLENTFEILLGDIVPPKKLQELLDGNGWEGTTIAENLERRLGSLGTKIFRRHMEEFNSKLRELAEGLRLNENFEPALLETKSKKRLWMKIKFVAKEGDYSSLHQDIVQINHELATLAMLRTCPAEVSMRLQEAPACTCDAAHIVNLRLQSIIDKQGRAAGAVRFKVTFSYDLKNAMCGGNPSGKKGFVWSWPQDRSSSGRENPPISLPLNFGKEIKNLCYRAERQLGEYSVGILDPGRDQWHRMQPPMEPLAVSDIAITFSLQELLRNGVLGLNERLQIEVQLASAAVQLHGTKWLEEGWCSEDILFCGRQDAKLRAIDGTWLPEPIVNNPFVRKEFGSCASVSRQKTLTINHERKIAEYDKCLFSLGIVLIELWFRKCFEDLNISTSAMSDD